jgi:oxygen-dependent protoporphyrinogen oxidase
LAQPLVAGIYSADPDRLSAPAALPLYVELEKKYGSVSRGLRRTGAAHKSASGARYAKFKTLKSGLQTWIEALNSRLQQDAVDLQTTTRVFGIARRDNGWTVSVSQPANSARHDVHEFDRLMLATPASTAAELLSPIDEPLAGALAKIEYTNVAVVSFGVATDALPRPLDAFGIVIPRREKRQIIAVSFSSVKFPDRAPPGHELVRVFIGGALQPQLALLPDDELSRLAIDELTSLLQLQREPQQLDIARWTEASPQYNLGYQEAMATINTRVECLGSLALAGSAYGGVGLPQCVGSGFAAADQLLR